MYTFYLDPEDPEIPYLAVIGEVACWFSVEDMGLDLERVWSRDYRSALKSPIEPEFILLGEYEDLNALKMIHLMEK